MAWTALQWSQSILALVARPAWLVLGAALEAVHMQGLPTEVVVLTLALARVATRPAATVVAPSACSMIEVLQGGKALVTLPWWWRSQLALLAHC